MSVHHKNHNYHIIDPSPWPLVTAFSMFIFALGAILSLRGIDNWVFIIGILLCIYSAIAWWRDVVQESHQGHHTPVVQLHHRYGFIIFIFSELMFFVGWFWMFFDIFLENGSDKLYNRLSVTGGTWPFNGSEVVQTTNPWEVPLLNTLLLLLSSVMVTWAHHALIEGKRKTASNNLLAGIILGLIFTCFQAYEYMEVGFSFKSLYGTAFFFATGFHGLHVIIGTIFLFVCWIRLQKGHFTPEQHVGFELAAWYWHFVDVIWLLLFACIYVAGA